MSNTTFKMTKLVGESSDGIESAVAQALSTSANRVRNQSWAHITDLRANLNADGGVDRWQVTVEVAFRVEEAS